MLEKNMMDAGVAFQRVSVYRRKKKDVLISNWREILPSTTTEVELIDGGDCNEVDDLILQQEQTAGYCLLGNTKYCLHFTSYYQFKIFNYSGWKLLSCKRANKQSYS